MDKDRIGGSLKQASGGVKETVGKITGDAKTQADGKAEKTEGKVRMPLVASRTPCATRRSSQSALLGPDRNYR